MSVESKSNILHVRLTPSDRAAIEHAAEKAGMTTSEYARACTLTMMLADLNGHALKVLMGGISEMAKEFAEGLTTKRVAT